MALSKSPDVAGLAAPSCLPVHVAFAGLRVLAAPQSYSVASCRRVVGWSTCRPACASILRKKKTIPMSRPCA
eukprot:2596603-Lingulodinium_polyedra.AAC.1